MVIVKSLATDQWTTWHRSLTSGNYIVLNSTAAQTTSGAVNRFGNGTTTVNPTDTVFTVGSNGEVNQTGNNYVAYLFAHDSGGFGLTGTDNVISCGSFTTNSSSVGGANLGYEPQWVLIKRATGVDNWTILDNMRGVFSSVNTPARALFPNTSGAESSGFYIGINATGFDGTGLSANDTYIYIAIRRGPMKVPTTGTSVFSPNAVSGYPSTITTNFPVDLVMYSRTSGGDGTMIDRLRGSTRTSARTLKTFNTTAEGGSSSFGLGLDSNVGYYNNYSDPDIWWNFRRAPGFFDEVCYTGTGSTQTISHNLAATPELIILRARSITSDWLVSHSYNISAYGSLQQNIAFAVYPAYPWNRTSTTFQAINDTGASVSGATYVAYLFASAPGVSKVGSFTGTGATQVIDCGFTGGARFVLIKATSTTGNWLVWDSARGIVSGNDPYLALNSTAAEVTNTDWVDTAASGFELSNAGGNLANSSGVSYIFLAIA
jgi:hypothetical protein